MALSDLAATTPSSANKGPACTVCQLLDQLEASEATALRSLLANPLWRYSALAEALEGEGHTVAGHTLARHARGQCAARDKLR